LIFETEISLLYESRTAEERFGEYVVFYYLIPLIYSLDMRVVEIDLQGWGAEF